MKDIDDIIYNADGSVTVIYTDGTSSTSNQTQNQGGYTSGTGGTTTGGYTSNGGKKWWEVALGVFPAIVSSIFGNSQSQTQTPYPYPTQSNSTASFGSMNMILIVGAAVLILLLLRKK